MGLTCPLPLFKIIPVMSKTIELTEQEHKDLTDILNDWSELNQNDDLEYDEQDSKWKNISNILFEKLLK